MSLNHEMAIRPEAVARRSIASSNHSRFSRDSGGAAGRHGGSVTRPSTHDLARIAIHSTAALGDVLSRADGLVTSDAAGSLDEAESCGCASDAATAPTAVTSATTAPTATKAPTVVAPVVPCAQPINWTHTGPVDFGPDAIRINITWGSSTGRLSDLARCTVREVVRYDPIPNPPFTWTPPNPTILTVPGTTGAGMDTHSYPPGLKTGITDPRVRGTMTAHQTYQFQCTGPGCSGNWTDFPGQTYDIVREVYPQYVRINPWRYRITKTGTGAGNTFSYFREVEVPVP